MGLASKRRTPAPTAARRSPWTRSAGCTLPARVVATAPTARGEPQASCASSWLNIRNRSPRPASSAARTSPRSDSICAADIARLSAFREGEVAVDLGLADDLTDRVLAAQRRVEEPHRLLAPEPAEQRRQRVLPAVHPAAVPPRSSGPAELPLEQYHVGVRRETLDPVGGPEAGEPAAHDAHVGARRARRAGGSRRAGSSAGPRPSRRPRPALHAAPRFLRLRPSRPRSSSAP